MPPNRDGKVTIAEVAKLAGVSTATAGRALGGYGYSSEEIRNRVREAAESIGYRPNLLARGLITGTTKTIGVVAGDIQSPFYASIVRGISDVARARNFGVIITNTDERLDREVEAVQLLIEKQVDGLIVAPCDVLDSPHLQRAIKSGCPIVQIDRMVRELGADSVTVDNLGASRDCVTFLLAAGHRRIGIIAELLQSDVGDIATFVQAVRNGAVKPTALFPSWQRFFGYLEAHFEAHVPVDLKLVPSIGSYSSAAAKRETLNLLRDSDRPTALFTADGLMSAGAMDAVMSLGMQVPGEISLACFDDLDWMQFSKPGITAIAQPLLEMGETAATLLLDHISANQWTPQHKVLRPTLTVRASVSRLSTS